MMRGEGNLKRAVAPSPAISVSNACVFGSTSGRFPTGPLAGAEMLVERRVSQLDRKCLRRFPATRVIAIWTSGDKHIGQRLPSEDTLTEQVEATAQQPMRAISMEIASDDGETLSIHRADAIRCLPLRRDR